MQQKSVAYQVIGAVRVSPTPGTASKRKRLKMYFTENYISIVEFNDDRGDSVGYYPVIVNRWLQNYPDDFDVEGLMFFTNDDEDGYELVPKYLHSSNGVVDNPRYLKLVKRIVEDTDFLNNAVHYNTESRIYELPPQIEQIYVQPNWKRVALFSTSVGVSIAFLFILLFMKIMENSAWITTVSY